MPVVPRYVSFVAGFGFSVGFRFFFFTFFFFPMPFPPAKTFFNFVFTAATEVRDVDPNAVIEVKDSSSSQGARLPNTFGPCPPGEVRRIHSRCRNRFTQ